MSFNEATLEEAIIEMLGEQGYPHVVGEHVERSPQEVLIKEDLQKFLSTRYAMDGITEGEIEKIIKQLEAFSAADLYESNKQIMMMVSDGFLLKREDRSQKDLYVELVDYSGLAELREPAEGELLIAAAQIHLVGFCTSWPVKFCLLRLSQLSEVLRHPEF